MNNRCISYRVDPTSILPGVDVSKLPKINKQKPKSHQNKIPSNSREFTQNTAKKTLKNKLLDAIASSPMSHVEIKNFALQNDVSYFCILKLTNNLIQHRKVVCDGRIYKIAEDL